MSYAELHCVSNFSFLRGASHPEELVARAHELGYAALAITDECSLAGVVRAHIEAKKCELPLIVGSEFRLDDGLRVVLLATDRESYGHLSALITRGRRSAEKGSYRLTRADLAEGVPGCLALWLPGRDPDIDEARWLGSRFSGALWIAGERLLDADDAARCEKLVAISAATARPVAAEMATSLSQRAASSASSRRSPAIHRAPGKREPSQRASSMSGSRPGSHSARHPGTPSARSARVRR
jgi:error-prone DNA polymerase